MMSAGRLVPALASGAAALLVACASSYSPPRIQRQEYRAQPSATKDNIYKAAIYVLRKAGYRFAFTDQDEGRITTRARTVKLSDRDCDCGTSMGARFATDSRTSTDASFFIIARDNSLTVSSRIEGRYVANDTSQVKRFHCVSRGELEKEVIDKISVALAEMNTAHPVMPVGMDAPAAAPQPAVMPAEMDTAQEAVDESDDGTTAP